MAEQAEKTSRSRAVHGFDCEPILTGVGARIRLRRQELEISQSDLAKKIKIATNSVSQYETGVVDMSVCRLAQIADALQTTPEYLLSGKDTVSTHPPDDQLRQLLEEVMRRVMREQQDVERQEKIARLRDEVKRTGGIAYDPEGVADDMIDWAQLDRHRE